jgi:hypothetical protein
MSEAEVQSKQEFVAALAAKLQYWAKNEALDTFADIVGDLLNPRITWKGVNLQGADPSVGMNAGYEYAELDEDDNDAWISEVFTDLPQEVQDRLSEKACESLELPDFGDYEP